MAITLRQTGRTKGSVTFSISGITNDRQTYIWIPYASEWVKLNQASANGYIKDFITTDDYNGSITVEFWDADITEYKCWGFYVGNSIDGYDREISSVLYTLLEFDYENTSIKWQGNPTDITVADLHNINLFGMYIDSWINSSVGGYWWDLSSRESGDKIDYSYLLLPATNIYNAASNLTKTELPNKDTILSKLEVIVTEVCENADFKAEYFNNIKIAINLFNLKV